MPAIVVRNISAKTHRALRVRARQHGRSTEAEIRAILDGVVRPRLKLGSRLAALVNRSAASSSRLSDCRPFPEWFLEEIRGRQIVTLALQVGRGRRDRRVFRWKILLHFELEALTSSGKSTVPARVNPSANADAASISGFASAA
jgi:plasmid stability protein